MASVRSLLRGRRRWQRPDRAGRLQIDERGATLTEYAFLVSVVVVGSIGAIAFLEDGSGSYLVDTGSDIGVPRELAADLDPDLPDPPPWLTQPPPPTTAPPIPTYPTGSVVHQGAMSSLTNPTECFDVRDPGVLGSTTKRVPCSGGLDQDMVTTGTGGVVAIQFSEPPNDTLCVASETDGVKRVKLQPCDGTDQQLWTVTDNGGSFTFTSVDTGDCLAENGAGLLREPCDGSSLQRFTFA